MKEPFNESYDTNQVLVNTDVKQQRVLTDEEKHSYRYFLQYKYIPELVADVSNGELPPDALLETDDWESYIRLLFDIDFFFEWDELRCDEIKVNDDYSIVLYTFPKPIQIPDATFGAVLINTTNNNATYYTLEYSFDEKWVLGSMNETTHFNYGNLESPELKSFIDWVSERIKD